MSMCLDKIDKSKIKYIIDHYRYDTAENISTIIDLSPYQIRDIARQVNVTKRKLSDDLYPNDKCWVDIISSKGSFSKYEISEYGHFRRKSDHVAIQWTYTQDDYCEVKLVNDDGIRVSNRVHRLVAETFYIVRFTDQIEVNHKDGNKHNNHYSNLEWVTGSENQKHSYKLNLRYPANLKHSLGQLELICKLIAKGLSNLEILDYIDFEIRPENIQNIRTKRTHKKISDKYF